MASYAIYYRANNSGTVYRFSTAKKRDDWVKSHPSDRYRKVKASHKRVKDALFYAKQGLDWDGGIHFGP